MITLIKFLEDSHKHLETIVVVDYVHIHKEIIICVKNVPTKSSTFVDDKIAS